MANILDGICSEGFILDGLDDWPRSATRKEWFRINRELVASTIVPGVKDTSRAKQLEMFAANGDVLLESTSTHTS